MCAAMTEVARSGAAPSVAHRRMRPADAVAADADGTEAVDPEMAIDRTFGATEPARQRCPNQRDRGAESAYHPFRPTRRGVRRNTPIAEALDAIPLATATEDRGSVRTRSQQQKGTITAQIGRRLVVTTGYPTSNRALRDGRQLAASPTERRPPSAPRPQTRSAEERSTRKELRDTHAGYCASRLHSVSL